MAEFVQEAILQILGAVLSLAVTAIGIYGTQFLRNNVFLQNLAKKKEITSIIVKFVEQAYKEIDGVDKLSKAKEEVLKWANNIGLKITEQELDIMIESAVKDLKLASQSVTTNTIESAYNVGLESDKVVITEIPIEKTPEPDDIPAEPVTLPED